jgi:signal transduction histidine kinase
MAAFVVSIFSELPLAFYARAFDTYNVLGHINKIVAFFLIYYGIYRASVKDPYIKLIDFGEKLKREIAERKQTEEALREASEALQERGKQLRDLSVQLLKAHEEERKRIAGELHDTIGACLSGIKFKVVALLEKIGESGNVARESLAPIIPAIQEGVEECRRIQMDLRPPMLDDVGLLPTLSWFCRGFQTIYAGIRVELEKALEESEIPNSLKIVIYRIIQEAMNNIAKHSKADHVRLCLRKRDERMELEIEDNGKGFELGKAYDPEGTARGLGLTSMKERTDLSGGFFSIESIKEKGTTIRASWPLNEKSQILSDSYVS